MKNPNAFEVVLGTDPPQYVLTLGTATEPNGTEHIAICFNRFANQDSFEKFNSDGENFDHETETIFDGCIICRSVTAAKALMTVANNALIFAEKLEKEKQNG